MSDYEVQELILFMENDRMMYNRKSSFDAAMIKKMFSGKFDASKSVKLWQYYVDEGAKRYNKEHGDGTMSLKLFDKSTRKKAAKEVADQALYELMNGDLTKAVIYALPESQVRVVKALIENDSLEVKGRKGAVDGLKKKGMVDVLKGRAKLSTQGKKMLGID